MVNIYMNELPPRCPPAHAIRIRKGIIAYRLVSSNPPSQSDFESVKKKQPDRKFKDDCSASSISVWAEPQKCLDVKLLPTHKNEKLCKVSICKNSGKIVVDKESKHIDWWPFANYNILSGCEVVYESYL